MVYSPALFRVTDRLALAEFIRQHPLATLITADGPRVDVSLIPLVLEGETLWGHFARANPQWKTLERVGHAVCVFHGPNGYISPTWYRGSGEVPTWNYQMVEVRGPVELHSDHAGLDRELGRMAGTFEAGRSPEWTNRLPAEERAKMYAAIVGFRIRIESIEGKFKLGQNRTLEDLNGAIAGVEMENPALAAAMRAAQSKGS